MKRLMLLALLSWPLLAPAADEGAVTVALDAGTTLESALQRLNAQGFRIVYSSALVRPTMTLRAGAKATRIDELLREILTPWNLRAVQAADGEWLVVAARAPEQTRNTTAPTAVPEPETIETIDVTASRFGLANVGGSRMFLDRQDVERMPHLADDAVRMLKVLPGVSGGDFSAALNIRGGRRDEALLMIDGAEIHNGFHFRDLDGALSVLDTNLVEGIDFVTGGMTSEYGDYMSGVVDLRTRRPREDDSYNSAVGISFVSAYGRTGGTFGAGRGSWLASARRGYLDVLMERVQDDDETLTPRYTDLFLAMDYDFSESTTAGVRTLLGNDNLKLITDEDDDSVDSAGEGEAAHVWVTLGNRLGANLRADTVVALSRIGQTRDSEGEERQRSGDVLSDFEFRFLDFRQDWSWTGSERFLPRWGVSYTDATAEYDYRLTGEIRDPRVPGSVLDISRASVLDVTGTKLGVYASWRTRLGAALTAEVGGRWDRYEYPGLEFDVASPRLNVVYDFGGSELRAAWGVLHQPQGVQELQVEDNVTQFFRPERSQHSVIGYTRRFGGGLSARVDIYRKEYSQLRPRFENALDPIQLIPEGSIDRVRIDAPRAEASGIEITLRREAAAGLAGWVSYTLAETREESQEGWIPRTWDQRHSVSFGTTWSGAHWNVAVAGLLHSGTPTTRLDMQVVDIPGSGPTPVVAAGPRNGERVGNYKRIDLRVSRDVQLAASKVSLYFEVTNLLDAENPCCVESFRISEPDEGPTRLVNEPAYWLPMLPSLGFQWEF